MNHYISSALLNHSRKFIRIQSDGGLRIFWNHLLAIMSARWCGYFKRPVEDLKLVSCKLRMRSQCTNSVGSFTFAAGSVKNDIIIYCILILLILSFKTDIDDCASHLCKNNETCTDRVNGFNCTCVTGYNGTQCETGNRNR